MQFAQHVSRAIPGNKLCQCTRRPSNALHVGLGPTACGHHAALALQSQRSSIGIQANPAFRYLYPRHVQDIENALHECDSIQDLDPVCVGDRPTLRVGALHTHLRATSPGKDGKRGLQRSVDRVTRVTGRVLEQDPLLVAFPRHRPCGT